MNDGQQTPPNWETWFKKAKLTLDKAKKAPTLADEWLDTIELAEQQCLMQSHSMLWSAQQDVTLDHEHKGKTCVD